MYENRGVRAAAPTESTSTAASSNTNAPAAPVPGSLGTMAGTVKAARALRMAGTAYFGEGMTMLIAATGHRPNKLGGYGQVAYRRLVTLAEAYLRLVKPEGIITGMALGWDQAWADAGLNLAIPVHAAVPFAGQESRWPLESQANFKRILDRCASVTIVCPGAYGASKMQIRNQWMVDKADRVCALWDGTSGGTANCVAYAESVGKPLDNIFQYLDAPQAIAIKLLDIPCAAIYSSQHTNSKGTCDMSIEALLQAQIDALKENTAAVLQLEASLVGRAGGNAKPSAKEEKPILQKGEKVVQEEKKPEPEVKEEAKPDPVEEHAAATSYETLRELVLKLAKDGKRAEIQKVSKDHGITAPKDLLKDPADMSSVTDQAKLEAVYADLLALEA